MSANGQIADISTSPSIL